MSRQNPGIDFEVFQNRLFDNYCPPSLSAVQDSVAYLIKTRRRDKESQIASLLRAVTCLDLTALSGDDCRSNLHRLCYKATNPIKEDILLNLGVEPSQISCGAICVYPTKITECFNILRSMESNVPIAVVAAGFPSAQYRMSSKIVEIEHALKEGAKEIDIVISRDLVLRGKWQELFEEVKTLREHCRDAKMKSIIAAGELGSLSNVYKASMVCMAAGSDFIKTSTGKESVNATLVIGTVMAYAIKDYYDETGFKVGFKPAGGIRKSSDVLLWQELMLKELGKEWLYPNLFRIGASNLLGDIEQTLAQAVSGCVGGACLPYF